MSALQNEIDKLKTLQESFDELSSKVLDTQAVLTELNNGKQELVSSINFQGGSSSIDETLLELAQDVKNLVVKNTNYYSDFEFIDNWQPPSIAAAIILAPDKTKNVSIKGITSIETDNIFKGFIHAERIHLPDCVNFKSFTPLSNGVPFDVLDLPNCTNLNIGIPGNSKGYFSSIGQECASRLRNIYIYADNNAGTSLIGKSTSDILTFDLLESVLVEREFVYFLKNPNASELHFPSLIVGHNVVQTTNFTRVITMPKSINSLDAINREYNVFNWDSLERVVYGSVTEMQSRCFLARDSNVPRLIDVAFTGHIKCSLDFNRWNPTYVLADTDKTAEINANIRNNIVAHYEDRTGKSPYTFTVSQALRDAFTEETEAAFAAKNISISPAKSV